MTENEVLEIMGEPKDIETHFFPRRIAYYGNAVTIIYKYYEDTHSYKVIEWHNNNNDPIISIGEKKDNAPPITLGSSISDVAAAIGTPYYIDTNLDFSIWSYRNNSVIYLDNEGKVAGWVNRDNFKIYMEEKNPNAPGIKKSSTVQDVLRAMGPTNEIIFVTYSIRHMQYGKSYISINKNGIVEGWNNNGELKLAQ